MSFVVIKIFAFESFTLYEIASIPNKGNIGMEIRPVLNKLNVNYRLRILPQKNDYFVLF